MSLHATKSLKGMDFGPWQSGVIEVKHLGRKPGKVKSLGAVLCVARALTTIFYPGKSFRVNHQPLAPTRSLRIFRLIGREPPHARSIGDSSDFLLNLLGDCKVRPYLSFDVQSLDSDLRDGARSTHIRCSGIHSDPSGNILLLKWTKEGVEDELHAPVNNVAATAVEAAADESTDNPATKSDVPKRFTSYRYHRTATKFGC
ncbi:hypothetical protein NL676_017824 [Syzygium grande]|nr:hypothetical protein NL676_017824 [Syzygium grande]